MNIGRGGIRRGLAVGTALALALGTARADYHDALRAYAFDAQGQIDRTDVAEALDMWRKYALAGDVLSRHVLGDLYSHRALEASFAVPLPEDTGVVPYDPVEALAWYSIAATHDFADFNQSPDFDRVNARIRARARLGELRREMTDAQVETAEERVIQLLSAGSAFDLYRLGVMHQSGEGLTKDNTRALMFYKLAQSRNLGSAGVASEAAGFLMSIMDEAEVARASQMAERWQPPLPGNLSGPSPYQVSLQQDIERLQALRAEPLFERLETQFDGNEHLIQNALAALGLYLGPIDGDVGPGTRDAIRKFQYTLVEDQDALTAAEKRDVQTGRLTVAQKLELIERAAARGHPQSQYVYGVMNADGIGVPVDGQAAAQWLTRSSNYGYPLAHFALGEYYTRGIQGESPLRPSRGKASFHYGQAAALGYEPAKDALVKLEYEFNIAQ